MKNREIRFRSWDGKQMEYGIERSGQFGFYLKNFSCQQCTGLEDTSGRQIYEGDIVKWGHIKGGEETPIRIAIVEINPDLQFKIKCTDENRKYYLGQDKIFHYGNFIYTDTKKWLEIIGNVHENPELFVANVLLAAGLPSAIWHKKWSERFEMIEEGTKVGYANDSGWFFYAEGKDEFIEQYSRFHNRGVINPCP